MCPAHHHQKAEVMFSPAVFLHNFEATTLAQKDQHKKNKKYRLLIIIRSISQSIILSMIICLLEIGLGLKPPAYSEESEVFPTLMVEFHQQVLGLDASPSESLKWNVYLRLGICLFGHNLHVRVPMHTDQKNQEYLRFAFFSAAKYRRSDCVTTDNVFSCLSVSHSNQSYMESKQQGLLQLRH